MKNWLVSGGTGFVGRALVAKLRERGDEVALLSRSAGEGRVVWDPKSPGDWQKAADGVDGIVHLAGAPIAGKRWSDDYKREIEESRVRSTELIVEAIGKASNKPSVLVSASAVGIFGADRPGEVLDEESAPGDDFLAHVCRGWEGAAREAETRGVRAVQVRFGVVLGEGGGALDKMVLPLKVGVGLVGKGDNVLAWVHLDDVVQILLRAMDDHTWHGAYHAVAPDPVTQRQICQALGAALHRPVIPSPEMAVRLGLGDGVEVLTGSVDARPKRTMAEGVTFRHPKIEGAAEAILGGPS